MTTALGYDSRRTSYTAQELLGTDFPEPRFAVPGLVPEGLNFFAGAPKLGKSWLALNLALAVAAGGRALGKIPVERGEVLYLALEDPPRRLKQRIKIALGGEEAPRDLHFETHWPPLNEGGVEELETWLTAHPACRLVVVDVFSKVRALRADQTDRYLADYLAAGPLKALADRHRLACLALHHTRKAAADDFLETVSGTHGLAGAADAVLVMRRTRGRADAELSVTGRDVEEKEFALRFAPELGAWTLLGDAGEWALSETRRKVIVELRSAGSPLNPKTLADRTGASHDAARQTVARMAKDDQLVAHGDGTYSLPPLIYPSHLSQPSLEEPKE